MRRVACSAGLGGISPQVSVRSPRLRGASGHREVEGWVAEEALPTVPFVTPGPAQLAHPPMATAGPPDPVPTERDTVRRPPPGPHASHKPFPQKEGWRGPALPFWVGQSPFSWPLARVALERRGHGSPDSMGATCRTALFIYLFLIFCPTRSMWKAPGWGLSQCHRGGNARIPNQLRPKATPFNSF